jgi:hypothetical protein
MRRTANGWKKQRKNQKARQNILSLDSDISNHTVCVLLYICKYFQQDWGNCFYSILLGVTFCKTDNNIVAPWIAHAISDSPLALLILEFNELMKVLPGQEFHNNVPFKVWALRFDLFLGRLTAIVGLTCSRIPFVRSYVLMLS